MLGFLSGTFALMDYSEGRIAHEHRPAAALRRTAALLTGARGARRLATEEGLNAYEVDADEPLHVLWRDGDLIDGEREAAVPVDHPWAHGPARGRGRVRSLRGGRAERGPPAPARLGHSPLGARLMEYATLGGSGLVVSRLVLGMMSYGNTSQRAWHLDLDGARPIVRAAVEAGVTVFDTADMYDLGASEEVTGRAAARAVRLARGVRRGDQGLLPDVGPPRRRRTLPQARAGRRRRLAAPARHRPHRPLPDPPVGPRHPDRGDHGGAGLARPGRQGPLPRGVQHVRLAARQGPARRRAARLAPASSRCRTTTTSPTARRSARCSRSASTRGRVCSPTARWPVGCSPAAGAATVAARRPAPGNDPAADSAYGPEDFDVVEVALRRGPRPRPAAGAGRAGLAAHPARRHRADRRRDQARSTSRTRSRRSTSPSTRSRSRGWRRRTGRTRSAARSDPATRRGRGPRSP